MHILEYKFESSFKIPLKIVSKKFSCKTKNSKKKISQLEALPLPWVITVLMLSLVSDLVTLIMAMNAINKGSIKENMSFMEYGEWKFVEKKYGE